MAKRVDLSLCFLLITPTRSSPLAFDMVFLFVGSLRHVSGRDLCWIHDGNLLSLLAQINHRMLLDAIMEIAGVPPTKFRSICSAIDKVRSIVV